MICARSPFPISHLYFSGKCWQWVRIITEHESSTELGPQYCQSKNSNERNPYGLVGQVELVSHPLQSPTSSGCSKSCQAKQRVSPMILEEGKDGSTFGPNLISVFRLLNQPAKKLGSARFTLLGPAMMWAGAHTY